MFDKFKKDKYLIVGLGNPEFKYNGTRHNVGFEFIDKLAEKYGVILDKNKFKSNFGSINIENKKVFLQKPLTYMNLSGEAIYPLIDYYNIPIENIIVVCDDININLGAIKLKKNGTDGGHNGLKNIIFNLGTNNFPRLRIGVGEKPKGWDLVDYVLGKFSDAEYKIIENSYQKILDEFENILDKGIDYGASRINFKGVK